MSLWDISTATFSILLAVSFLSTFLFNKFWWDFSVFKKNKDSFGSADWDPTDEDRETKKKKKGLLKMKTIQSVLK